MQKKRIKLAARDDKREGKSTTTQAGEFVRRGRCTIFGRSSTATRFWSTCESRRTRPNRKRPLGRREESGPNQRCRRTRCRSAKPPAPERLTPNSESAMKMTIVNFNRP